MSVAPRNVPKYNAETYYQNCEVCRFTYRYEGYETNKGIYFFIICSGEFFFHSGPP